MRATRATRARLEEAVNAMAELEERRVALEDEREVLRTQSDAGTCARRDRAQYRA